MPDAASEKPQIFTAEEIARYRADIDAARVDGAYRPGAWSVNPRNRDPRVVGEVPASIRLRDVTLRALETLPGVVLDPERQREFTRRLVATGVPEVVTAPARGRSELEMRAQVELIRSVNADCAATYPMVFTPDDLAIPAASGYDAVQVWVPPWGEASVIYEWRVLQAAWSGADWRELGIPNSRAGFVGRAAGLISAARDRGLRVTVPLLMVSYLDDDTHAETVAAVTAAGATEIALFDGTGGTGPEAMAALVSRTRELAPDVAISLHPHNSFGLAVAVAISAAKAGADAIEVSVNGYCGGPGNADLATTVAAFEALYGVSTGVRPGDLIGLARAAEDMTGYLRAYNQPVTGEQVYNWGGMDFMTQENAVDGLLHNCLAPGWAGATPPVLLTEGSGPFTTWDKLVALGFAPARDDVDVLLPAVRQQMAHLGRLATDDEIVAIATRQGIARA